MKNIIFKISFIIRRSIYLMLAFTDTKLKSSKNPITIFSYHSIDHDNWRYSINEDDIKKQILYLNKNYNIISLKNVYEYISGEYEIKSPSIVITFDDGYKDVLLIRDFLNSNDIKPALFLLADPASPNLKELGKKKEFLSHKDVLTLIEDGWEIGCHSSTHSNLINSTEKELEVEIVESKHKLEIALNIKIDYFAYPRGKYNENVLNYIKKAGYLMALTMDDGLITRSIDLLRVPRVGVDRSHSFSEFKALFSISNIKARKFIKSSFAGRYL